jgi:hypothetical protein
MDSKIYSFLKELQENIKLQSFLKGIRCILFLKNGLEKKMAEKNIEIISEVIIMRYVQQ